MKPKKDFLFVLDEVKAIVYQVDQKQMVLQTPDKEWTVHDLLEHMICELRSVPHIVMGGSIETGNALGITGSFRNNVIKTWRIAAIAAREAVHRCDPGTTAFLSYGTTSVADYLQEVTSDQLVHAWDLAKAIGIDIQFDEVLAKDMYECLKSQRASLAASGLYASPKRVSSNANYQVKLLGLLGRSSNWHQP